MKLRTVSANTVLSIFCVVYDYAGKADLSKGFWNPKRKLGVTTHVSEIIKQQQYKAMYCIFFHIEANLLSLKKYMVTPNFLFGYQEHLLSSTFSV